MSGTVSVHCRLPYGVVIDEPQGRVVLRFGLNRVPRVTIERWLARNSTLKAVKRGDISIINSRTTTK